MLVLSRKTGERIHIGEDIFVEVRRVAGNRVTLAVKAPREIRILRGELVNESASECNVFDEPVAEESAIDTVIMKHDAPDNSAAASTPHISAPLETMQRIHAK
ncbi:MAG: carbon storage regulator [Planctomycetales bacterium]|nr:carbon storage regulator [Planctomycetales bacterium]